MNQILELRQQQAAKYDSAKAILATAESEKRSLTEDELATVNKFQTEMEGIKRTIEALEKLDTAATDIGSRVTPKLAQVHDRAEDQKFDNWGDYLQTVRDATLCIAQGKPVDVRLLAANRAATGMGESIPSDGGFFVQKDFSTELFKQVYEFGQIMSRVRQVPISANSNGLKMNGVDESSRVNGSRWGGVRGYWADEAASVTATAPKFRQMEWTLNKLFATYYITEELMQDAAALATLAVSAFTEELTFKAEDAVIRGTGAGQPHGILNAAAKVEIAKESGQAAATVVYGNIRKMWGRMWARSRQSAVWLINQDVEQSLYDMKIEGASSGVFPVYLPPGGASGSPYGTLMGRPVIPVEYCETLGTAGDIILADLSQYLMIRKGGMQAAASMHVRFLNDEMCFRMTMRLDGQLLWNTAITPYKGTATQSPIITVAVRA